MMFKPIGDGMSTGWERKASLAYTARQNATGTGYYRDGMPPSHRPPGASDGASVYQFSVPLSAWKA